MSNLGATGSFIYRRRKVKVCLLMNLWALQNASWLRTCRPVAKGPTYCIRNFGKIGQCASELLQIKLFSTLPQSVVLGFTRIRFWQLLVLRNSILPKYQIWCRHFDPRLRYPWKPNSKWQPPAAQFHFRFRFWLQGCLQGPTPYFIKINQWTAYLLRLHKFSRWGHFGFLFLHTEPPTKMLWLVDQSRCQNLTLMRCVVFSFWLIAIIVFLLIFLENPYLNPFWGVVGSVWPLEDGGLQSNPQTAFLADFTVLGFYWPRSIYDVLLDKKKVQ